MLNSLPGAPPAVRELLADRPLEEIRPGLSRTRAVLEALGDPHLSYPTLQVAGTNGKGSTVACAGAVLAAHRDLEGRARTAGSDPATEPHSAPGGPAVGTYLSPHVVHFGERIQLDGRPAPAGLLDRCARRVLPEADRAGATHFEALTALALLAFAEAGCGRAVVETGMGGRLDATTVISPEACAITPVAVDHRAHLGRELADIAREKAGVIRPGTPAASAGQYPGPAAVLEERAREVEAPLLWLGRDARVSDVEVGPAGTRFRYHPARRGDGDPSPPSAELEVALAGRHQAANAGLALLLLEAAGVRWTAAAARRGLSRIDLPGRLQSVDAGGVRWVLDLGHNPAAVEAFLAGLGELEPARPWVALCSVLADKDWPAMVEAVAAAADDLVLTTAPSSPPGRRWDPEEAAGRAREAASAAPVEVEPDLARAASRAVELAGGGTVLVTGSSYLVGDVIRDLPGLPAGP